MSRQFNHSSGAKLTVTGDVNASVAQCYEKARDITVDASGCPSGSILYDKEKDIFSCDFNRLSGKDIPCAVASIAGKPVDGDCNVKVDISKSSCPVGFKTK